MSGLDPKRKKSDSLVSVRKAVWLHYVGESFEGRCFCCKHRITIVDFEAGHVVSKNDGGGMDVPNLRPICSTCNQSMKHMNMYEFIRKWGFHQNTVTRENVLQALTFPIFQVEQERKEVPHAIPFVMMNKTVSGRMNCLIDFLVLKGDEGTILIYKFPIIRLWIQHIQTMFQHLKTLISPEDGNLFANYLQYQFANRLGDDMFERASRYESSRQKLQEFKQGIAEGIIIFENEASDMSLRVVNRFLDIFLDPYVRFSPTENINTLRLFILRETLPVIQRWRKIPEPTALTEARDILGSAGIKYYYAIPTDRLLDQITWQQQSHELYRILMGFQQLRREHRLGLVPTLCTIRNDDPIWIELGL